MIRSDRQATLGCSAAALPSPNVARTPFSSSLPPTTPSLRFSRACNPQQEPSCFTLAQHVAFAAMLTCSVPSTARIAAHSGFVLSREALQAFAKFPSHLLVSFCSSHLSFGHGVSSGIDCETFSRIRRLSHLVEPP